MPTSDEIGSRGEAIFFILMTALCNNLRPLFRPQFLGEKYPTLDYLVELVGAGEPTPFFFVQVKATLSGYTKRPPRRLKVKVLERDVHRMIHYPAPTYVVGIDEVDEKGFIMSIHGTSDYAISSLPTQFPINCQNLQIL